MSLNEGKNEMISDSPPWTRPFAVPHHVGEGMKRTPCPDNHMMRWFCTVSVILLLCTAALAEEISQEDRNWLKTTSDVDTFAHVGSRDHMNNGNR